MNDDYDNAQTDKEALARFRGGGRDYNKKTAEEYREEAAMCRRRSQESFARSDTDGFLSQWASDINAQLAEERALLAEAGWVSMFWCLVDLDGNRANAKLINGKYGPCWAFKDDYGDFTGKFISAFPKRESTMAKKGYRETKEEAPAYAAISGSGTGLSGAANAFVRVFRTDGL